jgi:glutathione synthase
MAIDLGIVMDPIAGISIKKDTSFAMLLAAQRRGLRLWYMELGNLFLHQGLGTAARRRGRPGALV